LFLLSDSLDKERSVLPFIMQGWILKSERKDPWLSFVSRASFFAANGGIVEPNPFLFPMLPDCESVALLLASRSLSLDDRSHLGSPKSACQFNKFFSTISVSQLLSLLCVLSQFGVSGSGSLVISTVSGLV
jgi:hypothetical protein